MEISSITKKTGLCQKSSSQKLRFNSPHHAFDFPTALLSISVGDPKPH